MARFGELLYTMAKPMGDYNAVKKGNLGQRAGRSWAATSGWLTRMDGFPGLIPIHLSRPS